MDFFSLQATAVDRCDIFVTNSSALNNHWLFSSPLYSLVLLWYANFKMNAIQQNSISHLLLKKICSNFNYQYVSILSAPIFINYTCTAISVLLLTPWSGLGWIHPNFEDVRLGLINKCQIAKNSKRTCWSLGKNITNFWSPNLKFHNLADTNI